MACCSLELFDFVLLKMLGLSLYFGHQTNSSCFLVPQFLRSINFALQCFTDAHSMLCTHKRSKYVDNSIQLAFIIVPFLDTCSCEIKITVVRAYNTKTNYCTTVEYQSVVSHNQIVNFSASRWRYKIIIARFQLLKINPRLINVAPYYRQIK